MTKAPTPTEMSKGQSDNTNNATKKFDLNSIEHYYRTFVLRNINKINTYDNACMILITRLMYVLELPVRHNLHFFYK